MSTTGGRSAAQKTETPRATEMVDSEYGDPDPGGTRGQKTPMRMESSEELSTFAYIIERATLGARKEFARAT